MSNAMSLVGRHTDATHRLILDSSLELLERSGVTELTVRAVAKHAGMSERTVFRYYASRDEFLDAVAVEVQAKLRTPGPPSDLNELKFYPRALYACFEAKTDLVKSALHTEIFKRLREAVGDVRWGEVRALIDAGAPHRSEHDRRLVATNICYYLTATTWHYLRFYFGLSFDEAAEAAEAAVRSGVEGITH